jgi:ATP-dependent Lon protease
MLPDFLSRNDAEVWTMNDVFESTENDSNESKNPRNPINRQPDSTEARIISDELFNWYLDDARFSFEDPLEWFEWAVKSKNQGRRGDDLDALEQALSTVRRVQENVESRSLDDRDLAQDLIDDPLEELAFVLEEYDLPEGIEKKTQRLLGQRSDSIDNDATKWINWVLQLPWGDNDPGTDWSPQEVHDHLEGSHFGLEDLKERIVEELAVLKRTGQGTRTALCLSGPPGTGKTSIVKAIAEAIHRPFVKTSLGGLCDSTEIVGHHGGWSGTQPGQIVRRIIQAESFRPVYLLDEIDKIARRSDKDPTGPILQLLDPEQNDSFKDHYLEAGIDLSDVLFIATANDPERIANPLKDRLEIIECSGYSEAEKLKIARDYLLGEVIEANGLQDDELILEDGTLERLVAEFTDTPGVRGLKKRLNKLARKAVVTSGTLVVESDDLDEFFDSDPGSDDRVGFAPE